MTEGIHTRRVLNESGIDVKVRVKSDAQAALCNAAKLGPGRMRHLMTSATFVKDAVRRRMVVLEKVGTDSNIADPMTKHLAREKHESFLGGLGIFPAHMVVPATYNVQKQEKLNVLADITLVQADEEDQHGLIAAIYGEEEQPSKHSWTFHMMLFWAMIGMIYTAVDVSRRIRAWVNGVPQRTELANRVPQEQDNDVDVAHTGVGTHLTFPSDEGVYFYVCKSDDIAPPPPPVPSSSSSDMPSRVRAQTHQRFTTVTRQAPIWHSVGGERFHSSPDCRGLRGANGIKKKTQCTICTDDAVTSSTSRPTDWEM